MKHGVLSIVYGVVALLSALLFVSYFLYNKKKTRMFLALFGCVAVSNCGYFLLSICRSLAVAKLANGLSYFGGAFSILIMLLVICDVCQVRMQKWIPWCLTGISIVFFLLAASGDWSGLYYRSVSLEIVNGTTHLIKEYGPLHSLYALYLAGYIVLMLMCIAGAAKSNRLSSPKYTAFLFVTVLLNVGVWLVEQAIIEEFEFLSISYVITAVLLLLIYNMLCEYGIISPETGILSVHMLTQLNTRQVDPGALPSGMEAMFRNFAEKAKTLTSAERRILNYYIDGHDIAEIPDLAFISIHTVKKHNRSIYQKLEIASRDELMLYIELFRCCGRLDELTSESIEGT
jgi:DNA-binding CsgD family transcriptional regulator